MPQGVYLRHIGDGMQWSVGVIEKMILLIHTMVAVESKFAKDGDGH